MLDTNLIQSTSSWPFVEIRKLLKDRKDLIKAKNKITFQPTLVASSSHLHPTLASPEDEASRRDRRGDPARDPPPRGGVHGVVPPRHRSRGALPGAREANLHRRERVPGGADDRRVRSGRREGRLGTLRGGVGRRATNERYRCAVGCAEGMARGRAGRAGDGAVPPGLRPRSRVDLRRCASIAIEQRDEGGN